MAEPRGGEERALFTSAEDVAAGGDRPFLLRGDDIWFAAAGQVNVFMVRLERGEPAGPRRHLLLVPEGEALFGLGRAPLGERWGLLAVGTNGTRLTRVGQAGLSSSADPRSGRLAALVEAWIEALYAAMTRDKLPAISVELEAGRETEVGPATSVRTRSALAWVSHRAGHSRLLGREGLELSEGGFVPVSHRGWLEAQEATRLLALDTAQLPAPEDLWAGLGLLHAQVLRYAEISERAKERAAGDRMRQQVTFRDAVLGDACARLAATMTPGAETAASLATAGNETAVEDLHDPLFTASSVVGRALGLTIKSYPRVQGAPVPRDPLAATLRASRLRSRQVALREEWWRHDSGPLLGYLGEDKRPVALLRPKAGGSYVLHDPLARTERVVDARLAEGMEPFAHSFYRPFPERRLLARDVLRFGLQGCGRDIGLLLGVAICGSLLGMIPSIATGVLFNDVIPGAQRSQLLQIIFVLLGCAVSLALFNLAQGVALLRIEGRAGGALQSAVWDRLLSLPLAFFRPYTSGDLAVRAMSIDAIRQVVSGATASALLGAIFALGNFCLMFWYSPRMALWATLIIAIVIAVTLTGSYLQLRPQREAMKLQSKSSGIVLQLLSSIAKLRVAGVEVLAFAQWVRRFSDQRRLQYKARSISKWVAAFNSAVPVASYLVIFFIALPLITETHSLRTGDFLAFLSAFSSSTSSLLGTSLALLATLTAIPLYEQAKPILQAAPEVDTAKTDPGELTGDIEVQHAMFRYHQDGPLVLRDVSFRIQPGEFVAFVGPSGSGKSTLLRLLLGFENVEGGAIYFDEQEIGGLDVQALRRQIGVVLQSGRVMSGDLFTNIVGSASVSMDEAWEAARMAGLAEDIEAMPMGMHTVVSEGGTTLSGGQRQRLMIARAIVNRPRMLIFDEATSALDNRTQALVSASLERLQATRIVVAHRLSTIINADRIFVMQQGRLVQSGTYTELMAEKGPFAELARRQIA